MRLPRHLPQFAAVLLLGPMSLRIVADEVANPSDTLPICPDDAAAQHHAQKLSETLDPKEDIDISFANVDSLNGKLSTATVSGGVVVHQGDRTLTADHLSRDPDRIDVNGTVEYRDPQLVVRGNSGSFDGQQAAFEGAQFELPTRPARGSATHLAVDNNGIVKLDNVQYTTCPAGKPDWLIRADSVSLDTTASTGTARHARVDFLGVPLLWLPVISFPVGDARKTGFLFPSVGTSTSGGAQMSVPWYWNIAPAQDLTLTPTWYTARGVEVEGEYRFLTRDSHGDLLGNFLPDDHKTGHERSRWRLNDSIGLPGDWRLTLAAENVSDTAYFEDFAQKSSDGASTAFLPRVAELDWRDASLHAGVRVSNFQTLDAQLAQADRPATEAPDFYLLGDWALQDGALPLTYGVDAEATRFRHPGEVQGWRLDAEPRVGLDYNGAGYFFRPSALLDTAAYYLHDNAPGSNDSPTRTLPVLSLDTGLIFEGDAGSHAQRRVTLEPRLMYLYAPYRDQSDMPLFDTNEPDLNWIELFRTNRYVGLDRISDANQVSFGVTTQVYSSRTGERILSTTIGQIFNFRKPRVRLPGEPPDAGNASDLTAQIELAAYHHWNISTGLQWNPYENRTERAEVRLQYHPEERSVVNVGYRYQNGELEQAEVSTAWPLFSHWRLYGQELYSLRENKSIDEFAGFEYGSCCWNLRALARDYVSRRTGEHDRSVYLQLELKGLSNVGQAADAFLEKAIRGYSTRQRP